MTIDEHACECVAFELERLIASTGVIDAQNWLTEIAGYQPLFELTMARSHLSDLEVKTRFIDPQIP